MQGGRLDAQHLKDLGEGKDEMGGRSGYRRQDKGKGCSGNGATEPELVHCGAPSARRLLMQQGPVSPSPIVPAGPFPTWLLSLSHMSCSSEVRQHGR